MIKFQVKQHLDKIVLQFDEPRKWLGLTARQTVDLANALNRRS